jgi:glycosyltransferase involved in cell wall biosynthesis
LRRHKHPLFSILLPVYNGVEYLEESVESVLNQTFGDFELLLLDDGSTDGSQDVAKRLAAKDSRIGFHQLDHGGLPATLNRGIELARHPWIARIDQDDLWEADKLEKQARFIEAHPNLSPPLGLVATFSVRIDESGKTISTYDIGPVSQKDYCEKVEHQRPVTLIHPSVVFLKAAAREVGGYRNYPTSEDLDFFTRLAEHYTIRTLPERLVRYRVTAGSMSEERFRECFLMNRFVVECAKCRAAGVPEPTWDEFQRDWNSIPWWRRLRRDRKYWGLYFQRQGARILLRRNPVGLIYLLLAAVMQPQYMWRKVVALPWAGGAGKQNAE